MAAKKQAVLLVHGMGEQIPMETLRGFVETMWVEDDSLTSKKRQVWFKPDSRNDSAELWRITTGRTTTAGSSGQRVDFYEFYWADLTASNTLEQLKEWFLFLLLRRPSQVPPAVTGVWIFLWLATLIIGGLLGWKALAALEWAPAFPACARNILIVLGALYALSIKMIVAYLGDVARYCRAAPYNIAARRAVRERGLARLKALAASGEYDRIVLVGHSLGSIAAYDILKLAWADWVERTPVDENSPLFAALQACHAAGVALEAAPKPGQPPNPSFPDLQAAFQKEQAAVFAAAADDPRPPLLAAESTFVPWLISDFVTMGAALTHAEFLLARNPDEFKAGRQERRFPSIPPIADGTIKRAPSYMFVDPGTPAQPVNRIDHAAGFAAVRWTNIYDAPCFAVFGDIVSGKVAPIFGPGALDVPVRMTHLAGLLSLLPRIFTHTLYWTDGRPRADDTTARAPLPRHIGLLRKALNLARLKPPL